MKIYERLSQIYDLGWGKFAMQYVGFINQLLDERGIKRARILDLACGTGVLAVELAGYGHFVHGIDISPQMVEIARLKSTGLSNVSFEVQDMTQFGVEDKFDLATCTFDSINYLLDTDGLKVVFCRIADILRESGLFVFDSNTNQLYAARQKGRYECEIGGESFVQSLSYDPVRKESTTVFEFGDGNIEVHKQRPYDLVELEPILTEAGLRIVHTFSGFNNEPYSSKSERLICVTEREVY